MVDFGVLAAPGGPDGAFHAIKQALRDTSSPLLRDAFGQAYFARAMLQRTTLASTSPIAMPSMLAYSGSLGVIRGESATPTVPAWARFQKEIVQNSSAVYSPSVSPSTVA